MTRLSAVASAVYAATMLVSQAEGHAMVLDPPSRQGLGETNGCPHCWNARGPQAVVARAKANTDPEVLAQYGGGDYYPNTFGEFAENGNFLEPDEIAVRHGVCGDPWQNAEESSNLYSTANINWEVPEGSVYKSGGVIEINTIYNAWHYGHMEFFICDTQTMDDPDGIPTQECFNKHPLTRAEGGSGSPIDPNYSGRYYVDPPARFFELQEEGNPIEGYNVRARYYLPDIETSHAILQMVYYTGNSCRHVGYDDFNPPQGSWPGASSTKKADWIDPNPELCSETTNYPEEFWACSDIAISPDGFGEEPAPAPTPNPHAGEDDGDMSMNYEVLGCFSKMPGQWVVEGPWMSYNVCYLSCVSQGAYYMGITAGTTCYCEFDKDLDVDSLEETTGCTTQCTKDISFDMCGGDNVNTVLRITPGFVEEGMSTSSGDDGVDNDDAPAPTPEPYPEYPETPQPVQTPSPQQEQPEEGECSALYMRCGGDDDYSGSTCCESGADCVVMADCYSECRPAVCTGEPVEMWGQCGGSGWEGSTCCEEDTECTVRAPCYSSCRPTKDTKSEGTGY